MNGTNGSTSKQTNDANYEYRHEYKKGEMEG